MSNVAGHFSQMVSEEVATAVQRAMHPYLQENIKLRSEYHDLKTMVNDSCAHIAELRLDLHNLNTNLIGELDSRTDNVAGSLKEDQVLWSNEIAENLKTFGTQMDLKIVNIFETLRSSIEELKISRDTVNCVQTPLLLPQSKPVATTTYRKTSETQRIPPVPAPRGAVPRDAVLPPTETDVCAMNRTYQRPPKVNNHPSKSATAPPPVVKESHRPVRQESRPLSPLHQQGDEVWLRRSGPSSPPNVRQKDATQPGTKTTRAAVCTVNVGTPNTSSEQTTPETNSKKPISPTSITKDVTSSGQKSVSWDDCRARSPPPSHEKSPQPLNRYSRQNMLVLMDSNRKNVDFNNLFPDMNVTVAACGNMEYAANFVRKDNDNHPDVVVIHLGTNDLRQLTPEVLVNNMIDLVYLVEKHYKCSVKVSEILPRRDNQKLKVRPTNLLLASSGLPVIGHDKIRCEHLYDEVHLGLFSVDNDLSGVQLLAKDLYVGMYGKEPPTGRLSRVQMDRSKSPSRRGNKHSFPKGNYRNTGR